MLNILTRLFGSRKPFDNLDEATRGKLSHYISLAEVNKTTTVDKVKFVAVDFETTGLNPKSDNIISMGFCPVVNDAILLSGCLHIVIQTDMALESENVAIHGLTDDQLELGLSPELALDIFMRMTEGKVIIAHYHGIEANFTQKLAKTILGVGLPLRFVDTFKFAERQLTKKNRPIIAGELRLFNLRKQMKLPNYKAHNALEDAISTAELFLAQKASLNMSNNQVQLNDMGFSKY